MPGAGVSPAPGSAPLRALRFDHDARTLYALDQTALPFAERELALRSAQDVAAALRRLAIRGAPLIGVAAAYGVVLDVLDDGTAATLQRACATLVAARPTAVNLAWAVRRVGDAAARAPDIASGALSAARAIEAQETEASVAMGRHGADLLAARPRILTHCNTGLLAAPGRGSALSVVAELHDRGELREVIATESRPLLQGARLTVWELRRLGIPHSLIVDSAAAGLLARGAADAVIVGCDRVAANGDTANKVGTYGLALAARAAGVPFVVVGPTSTVDHACPSGAEIAIEERDGDEVRHALGQALTLPGTPVRNPAFDVTPAALITALVTEAGVVRAPSAESLGALAAAPV